MTNINISLRPTQHDEEFLCEVYCSQRRAEVAAFGWETAQQDAFLRMQFNVRQQSYKMQFPTAEHSIILIDETPAGSIIVDRSPDHISLTDIAVLPQYQRRGIATQLLRRLQDEAAHAKKPLVLSVEKSNDRAFKLYKACDFEITGESTFSYSMQWNPAKT